MTPTIVAYAPLEQDRQDDSQVDALAVRFPGAVFALDYSAQWPVVLQSVLKHHGWKGHYLLGKFGDVIHFVEAENGQVRLSADPSAVSFPLLLVKGSPDDLPVGPALQVPRSFQQQVTQEPEATPPDAAKEAVSAGRQDKHEPDSTVEEPAKSTEVPQAASAQGEDSGVEPGGQPKVPVETPSMEKVDEQDAPKQTPAGGKELIEQAPKAPKPAKKKASMYEDGTYWKTFVCIWCLPLGLGFLT